MFLSISFIEFVKDKFSFFDTSEDKIAKYWPNQTRKEVLEEADALFQDDKYMDVYENLNRIKYSKDIEVIWRLAKSLYHLSLMEDITAEVRRQMIEEAHNILESTHSIGKGKSNYHKWMAIISNTKNGFESLETKIQEYTNVRDHLNEACKTNPKDFTVQYMLGRWHYEMANLTWFQRKIAKYLYLEPPVSTFQDAHKHLIKAEELQPRTFLPNIYILGSVCMKLGQYYRAKYYLNLALNIPTECDKCCLSKARSLLMKLERYDLGKDLLHENYQFGFEN